MSQKNDQTHIPANIQALRRHLRLTQVQLGERLGIGHKTMQAIERGRVRASADMVSRLAIMAGISPSAMYAGLVDLSQSTYVRKDRVWLREVIDRLLAQRVIHTQTDLARELNTHYSSISKYLNPKYDLDPPMTFVEQIEQKYGAFLSQPAVVHPLPDQMAALQQEIQTLRDKVALLEELVSLYRSQQSMQKTA